MTDLLMAKTAKKKALDPLKRKIYIVEDHPVFREGLVQVLEQEKDLEVCGEAGDAERGLRDILRLRPDLAIIDITLPGRSGLDLIKELKKRKLPLKILVVSMHDEALYADRVLRAGGDGYIMKQEDPSEIVHAARDVLNGHVYVSEDVVAGRRSSSRSSKPAKNERPLEKLTDSELELLELLGSGISSKEIAHHLRVEGSTVNTRCAQVRKKLNLPSLNALICYAARNVDGT